MHIFIFCVIEGVLVAEKDFKKQSHSEELPYPNYQVIKLMTSLKSRGYVNETFNWNHYYWYLKDEGIEYLREYLHLPPGIVPNTLKKPAARPARANDERGGGRRDGKRGRFGGERDGYYDKNKSLGPSGDFKPRFEGGGRREGGGRGFGRNSDRA